MLRHYNAAGFQITSIDGDKEFEPFRNDLKDTLDIDVNIRAGRDKQPEAEKNNRVIGKRCRTVFHNMPHKQIPKTMIIEMGKLAAEQLNYFPVKGGVSPCHSPHMTLDGLNLDYEKDCQCNFGAYVQAFAESPDAYNSQAPRTINAIYLRPLP